MQVERTKPPRLLERSEEWSELAFLQGNCLSKEPVSSVNFISLPPSSLSLFLSQCLCLYVCVTLSPVSVFLFLSVCLSVSPSLSLSLSLLSFSSSLSLSLTISASISLFLVEGCVCVGEWGGGGVGAHVCKASSAPHSCLPMPCFKYSYCHCCAWIDIYGYFLLSLCIHIAIAALEETLVLLSLLQE